MRDFEGLALVYKILKRERERERKSKRVRERYDKRFGFTQLCKYILTG